MNHEVGAINIRMHQVDAENAESPTVGTAFARIYREPRLAPCLLGLRAWGLQYLWLHTLMADVTLFLRSYRRGYVAHRWNSW